MIHSSKFRTVTALVLVLTFSTGFAHGQSLPAPAPTTQKARPVKTASSQESQDDAISALDPAAAKVLVERLVVLISDKKANPDQRARACEYLGKFGDYGAAAVPAITGFIEHQLTTGKLKYYFQGSPSSVIVYPKGTAARLGQAVYALGEVGSMAGEAIPLLRKVTALTVREESKPGTINANQTNTVSPRSLAAEAIGKIGRPEAVDILIGLSNSDPNADTRTGAVKGLARLAASEDTRTAITAQAQLRVISVTDSLDTIREQAGQALERQSQMTLTKVTILAKRKN